MLRPTIDLPAIVRRDWKRYVLKRAVVTVEPAPQTLVNLDTDFSTGAPASYVIDAPILGRQVHITARAQQYLWQLGDGTSAVTPAGSPRTTHTYKISGEVAVRVDIAWTGSFTIGDDPTVLPVEGTARTQGVSIPLGVREARSQYESGGR